MNFKVRYFENRMPKTVTISANRVINHKGFISFRKNFKTVFMVQASFVVLVELVK